LTFNLALLIPTAKIAKLNPQRITAATQYKYKPVKLYIYIKLLDWLQRQSRNR